MRASSPGNHASQQRGKVTQSVPLPLPAPPSLSTPAPPRVPSTPSRRYRPTTAPQLYNPSGAINPSIYAASSADVRIAAKANFDSLLDALRKDYQQVLRHATELGIPFREVHKALGVPVEIGRQPTLWNGIQTFAASPTRRAQLDAEGKCCPHIDARPAYVSRPDRRRARLALCAATATAADVS